MAQPSIKAPETEQPKPATVSPAEAAGGLAPPGATEEEAERDQETDELKTPEQRLSVSGESLYAILNIKKGATEEEIKKAYRKMALKYHPDKNRDNPKAAEERFKPINHAHSVLTDEKKKQIYDEYGSLGLYIADQVGEDYVDLYFMVNSKCFRITSLVVFLITGCCCCCCLCCCFCGCCGLCKKCRRQPEEDEEDGHSMAGSMNGDAVDSRSGSPVTTQPAGGGGVLNESFGNGDEKH